MSYELDTLWEKRQENFNTKAISPAAFAKACPMEARKVGAPVSKEWDRRIREFEQACLAVTGKDLAGLEARNEQ
jgi:hypothetical protein